jgi:hypothetical protein
MLANPVGMQRLGAARPSNKSLVEHPRLQALHGYWLGERGTHLVPAKEAFDFKNLKAWLGHVALIDVAHDPIRFRFRLYGTYLAELAGADLTGKSLDHVALDRIDSALDPYLKCVTSMSPVAFSDRYRASNGAIGVVEQLLLPCSSDDEVVDIVVGALYLEAERN